MSWSRLRYIYEFNTIHALFYATCATVATIFVMKVGLSLAGDAQASKLSTSNIVQSLFLFFSSVLFWAAGNLVLWLSIPSRVMAAKDIYEIRQKVLGSVRSSQQSGDKVANVGLESNSDDTEPAEIPYDEENFVAEVNLWIEENEGRRLLAALTGGFAVASVSVFLIGSGLFLLTLHEFLRLF